MAKIDTAPAAAVRRPSEVRSSNFQSIQCFRGIAALTVIAYHLYESPLATNRPGGLLSAMAGFGWLGVNLFFVISGFIILSAHRGDIGDRGRLARYIRRRAIRLYPAYWVFLTLYIGAAAMGLGHPDFKWEFRHLVSAYTLFAWVDFPTLPLKVAWTLLFEVKFYLVFALLLISKRLGALVISSWGVAVLVRAFFSPPSDWGELWPDLGFLSAWNAGFFTGMAAYLGSRSIGSRFGIPWIVGSCLALGALACLSHGMEADRSKPLLMLGYGMAFGMLILGGVLMEQHKRMIFPRWIAWLGDASYSLYLTHSAVISLFVAIAQRPRFTSFEPVFLPLAFALAVAIGWIAHRFVEVPLLSLLRSWSSGRRRETGDPAIQR